MDKIKSLTTSLKTTFKILVLSSMIMMLGLQNLYAQTPDAGALQQQLQREVDRARQPPVPEQFINKQLSNPPAVTAQNTIDVKSFTVSGLTLITQEQAQKVLLPYNNRPLTFEQIKEAAAAVSALYLEKGRVAQAVIPQQNVTSGIIEIKIIEGRVGEVKIELDPSAPSRLKSSVIQKFIAEHNTGGEFIDLKGLERSLSLLNELPGNEVSGILEPGQADAQTNILVSAKDTHLINGRVDATNYGAANTGVAQTILSLGLNNPSGSGDQAALDIIASEGSLFGQFKYGLPIGYNGWRVAAGVSALDYRSLSSYSPITTQGTAQTYGLYSTYALERSALSNKTIAINFENKNYSNQAAGVEATNYQLNDLSVGISGSNFVGKNYYTWGSTLTGGYLTINNVNQFTNDANGAATQGFFAKLGFNASASTPLPIEKTMATFSLYGQLSNKNLNSAEQFYLGGPYGVRAYPVAQGGGAQGAIASIEIMHVFENNIQLGAFIDAGLIQQYINPFTDWQGQTQADNTYPLFAIGPIMKYNYERFQLSGALAWRIGNNPLYDQNGQQLNSDNTYRSVQGWIKGTAYF